MAKTKKTETAETAETTASKNTKDEKPVKVTMLKTLMHSKGRLEKGNTYELDSKTAAAWEKAGLCKTE